MYHGNNNYIQGTFGTITVPTGYKLLGVIPFPSYGDRFLVSFGFGKHFTDDSNSNVPLYYVIENKWESDIQQQVTATAVFIKNENFITI